MPLVFPALIVSRKSFPEASDGQLSLQQMRQYFNPPIPYCAVKPLQNRSLSQTQRKEHSQAGPGANYV